MGTQNVELAQQMLYQKQAHWVSGLAPRPPKSPRDVAVEAMQRRLLAADLGSDYVQDGPFRYEATTERARYARTKEIIDRVGPGPDEDGQYLEMLARQAASVELTLLDIDNSDDSGFDFPMNLALQRILLGTTGEPRSAASTSAMPDRSAAVIAMSAGMMYLMYQAAKAVVLSWRPVAAPAGSAVSFSSLPEDVAAILDTDQRPVIQLSDTLRNWMVTGVARPTESVAPPPEYRPPLMILISNSERWIIAHEYCHALFDRLGYPSPPWLPTPNTDYEKEFRADLLATLVLINSGANLDLMAPNMVLMGATLAMRIHEVAYQAINLALGGDGNLGWASTSHPPFSERAEATFLAYENLLDASDEALELDPAYLAAATLDELWRRARPIFEADLASGAPIHSIWS